MTSVNGHAKREKQTRAQSNAGVTITRRIGAVPGCLALMFSCLFPGLAAGELSGVRFRYKPLLQAEPQTLRLWVQSVDALTGQVVLNGVDTRPVTKAFTWDFGDGTVETGWFPQQHFYKDISRNYIVKATSHYAHEDGASTEVLVCFTRPSVAACDIPDSVAVTIPDRDRPVVSRVPAYVAPPRLTRMPTSCFGVVPREIIEYVLSVATAIQIDLANDDVLFPEGSFEQVVLQDPTLQTGGMYSLWFTTPVSFAASCEAMNGSVAYSSFFHEIGHNVTLNFPRQYHFGGKIDGNANAIYSEAMAQIFQHATAYEMLNHADAYGLSEDIIYDIAQNATATFLVIKEAYARYVRANIEDRFSSWNDPDTPGDETLDTFMTITYKFIEHVELDDRGFRTPTQRLCRFLGFFNPQWSIRFSQYQNDASAESFRASLMVAALSYALQTDLREEFEMLGFPVDDMTFADLTNYVETGVTLPATTLADLVSLSDHWLTQACSPLNGWSSGTDRNASGRVDFHDYAILATYWSDKHEPVSVSQELGPTGIDLP